MTCHFAPSQLGFEVVSELQGDPGYPLGRFGAAITALTDINGDELADVAVGAPLEGQGAVYIFNGQRGGLSPQPSQVRGALPANQNLFPGTQKPPSPDPTPQPDSSSHSSLSSP